MAPLELDRAGGRPRIFLNGRRSARRRARRINGWLTCFLGTYLNRKDLAMRAFLRSCHERGHSFASALCGGLIVVSLALASPALAAGGGAGGGGGGGGAGGGGGGAGAGGAG